MIKITIEHMETKRRIEGPFNLYISANTAALIIECLEREFGNSRSDGQRWVSVVERQPSINNTQAIDWEAPGC